MSLTVTLNVGEGTSLDFKCCFTESAQTFMGQTLVSGYSGYSCTKERTI